MGNLIKVIVRKSISDRRILWFFKRSLFVWFEGKFFVKICLWFVFIVGVYLDKICYLKYFKFEIFNL